MLKTFSTLVFVSCLSIVALTKTTEFSKSAAAVVYATTYVNSSNPFTLNIQYGKIDKINGASFGSFENSVNVSGWGKLFVSANTTFALKQLSALQMGYSIGYLEGALSQGLMWDAYCNYVVSNNLNNSKLPEKVKIFLSNQWHWMNQQVVAHKTDAYWINVGALLQQVVGMADGYRSAAPSSQQLDFWQVYTLTLSGDLEDLLPALTSYQFPVSPRNKLKVNAPVSLLHMDCSGLVKLRADFQDLYVGHSTFNGYSYMLRVFKHYEINLSTWQGVASLISFSARPGDIESKDDFYLLNSKMSVIETSLTTFNKTLYSTLTPYSLPCWLRVQLSNRMAKNAKHWTELFGTNNGGTHNNDWIVVDYKAFEKRKNNNLAPNTVWRLEQMGPYIQTADVTFTLLQTDMIVPSFNVPYFDLIFNVSGYRAAGYNYTTDTRHKIFARDQHTVNDLNSMAWLMNGNDYQNDPLCNGDGCCGISARCDLNPKNSSKFWSAAFGGIDSKIIDSKHVSQHKIWTISSPSHQTEPPFAWTSEWATTNPHQGMPYLWNFGWSTMTLPTFL